MAKTHLPIAGGHVSGFGATFRNDTWWVSPAISLAILSAFVGFANYRILEGTHYYAEPYLTPLYSPLLFVNTAAAGAAPLHHAWFGAWPSWIPAFIPASPAALVLMFPAMFRFTCYYYRKAYYRAFAGSPPGCAVGPLAQAKPYKGETYFLIFQNLHRYALYFALLFIPILYYDAALGFFKGGRFGVGVGSLVLTINATLIAGYTFGCHSFRHLIGGHDDCMSCGKQTLKHTAWKKATWFNERHAYFAWASLLFVMFTDVYVTLVSRGVIRDLNTW